MSLSIGVNMRHPESSNQLNPRNHFMCFPFPNQARGVALPRLGFAVDMPLSQISEARQKPALEQRGAEQQMWPVELPPSFATAFSRPFDQIKSLSTSVILPPNPLACAYR